MGRDSESVGVGDNRGVQGLLDEFWDVFPDELPNGLSPLRGIEHQIDLIPGAALPNKPAYRCNPEETKELQRKVQVLMDMGKDEDEHKKHLRAVFEVLRKQKLCADALSRRHSLFIELDARILGFKHIKELYKYDPEFSKEIIEPIGLYSVQDGYLFKGNRLCIPNPSIRELLVREAHGRAIVGHFGENKTNDTLSEHFYWPKMSKDVQ
ncbi:uncharacterized protein LOC141601702 [Silene latifolia]|uniref:uncharacterized protein LOC141601702 n=1 Tax=Silene latifolia TaxID=37657 RepID=UPI003D780527